MAALEFGAGAGMPCEAESKLLPKDGFGLGERERDFLSLSLKDPKRDDLDMAVGVWCVVPGGCCGWRRTGRIEGRESGTTEGQTRGVKECLGSAVLSWLSLRSGYPQPRICLARRMQVRCRRVDVMWWRCRCSWCKSAHRLAVCSFERRRVQMAQASTSSLYSRSIHGQGKFLALLGCRHWPCASNMRRRRMQKQANRPL